jgi:hypothetical protein
MLWSTLRAQASLNSPSLCGFTTKATGQLFPIPGHSQILTRIPRTSQLLIFKVSNSWKHTLKPLTQAGLGSDSLPTIDMRWTNESGMTQVWVGCLSIPRSYWWHSPLRPLVSFHWDLSALQSKSYLIRPQMTMMAKKGKVRLTAWQQLLPKKSHHYLLIRPLLLHHTVPL